MRGGAPPFELSGRRETRAESIRTRGVLLYVTLAAEGANEADGPLSAACYPSTARTSTFTTVATATVR
jgi:hypothetical protein